MKNLFLSLTFAFLAASPSLSASLITYTFTGRTANSGTGDFAPFSNVAFSGSLTYNDSSIRQYGISEGTTSLQSLIINFDNGESVSTSVNWSMTQVINTWGLSSEGAASIFMGQATYATEPVVAFSPADGLFFKGMSFQLPGSVGYSALSSHFANQTGLLGQVSLSNGTTSIGLSFTQGTLTLYQTPEPGTIALLLAGGVAALAARKRRS